MHDNPRGGLPRWWGREYNGGSEWVHSFTAVQMDLWMSSGSMESIKFLAEFADRRKALNKVAVSGGGNDRGALAIVWWDG